jgi:hypothetical protein
MFEEFTRNLRTQLQQERVADPGQPSGTAAQPTPIKAVPLVLSVAKESAGRFFRRIFGGPDSR